MYSDLENTSQCFEIRSLLRTTRQGTMNVTEYFNRLVNLWQEMDLFYSITWKCSEHGVMYNQVLEKDRVFDFLQGLNKDLDEVRGRILVMKPMRSLRKVFSEVRREESRRRVMLTPNQGVPEEEQPQGLGLVSSRFQNQKVNKDARHRCEHCKKPFHTKATCWEIHGKPKDWKPRSQRAENPTAHAAERVQATSSYNIKLTPQNMDILKSLLDKLQCSEATEPAPKAAALVQRGASDFRSYDWTSHKSKQLQTM